MITFEDLMARASDQLLQELVGKDVVHLLAAIDSGLMQPTELRETLLELTSPAELLLDQPHRTELLMLLPRDEADRLAQRLGLDGDPYAAFENLRIRRRSAKADALLGFFSVEAEDESADTTDSLVAVTPTYPLFDHQRLAARRVTKRLAAEPHRVLLHMPTGSGKTRTAMTVICELLNRRERMLVVWLAHSEELCEQAASEFAAAWRNLGNRSVSVQRWWGPHTLAEPIIDDGLIVAGLAKAASSLKRSFTEFGAIAGKTSLVVMDEAHQAIAPTYQQILQLLHTGNPTALLGLTATPGRTWNDVNEDERLADFFYRHKVTLEVSGYSNPIDYLTDEGYLARAEFSPLHYTSSRKLSERDLNDLQESLDIPERILRLLAEDAQRNLRILARAEKMTSQHARIIIFAATKNHAAVLATALRSRGTWARSIVGDTPAADRARTITEFKSDIDEPRILVNYGVLTTGFDAPQTSGAIIARPTKSLVLYSQMVGRATRGPKAGGNAIAEVATVVDSSLPGFSTMAETFTNWEDVW